MPEGDFAVNFHYIEMDPFDMTTSKSKSKGFHNGQILRIKQPNDILIFKDSDDLCNFDTVEFSALEDNNIYNKSSDYYKNYSGCTLSSFNIGLYTGKSELFAISEAEKFSDIFLILIDKFLDIEKKSITTNWKLTISPNRSLKEKNLFNENELYQMILELKFELDPLTRACIMKRLHNLLDDLIITRRRNQMNIDEILDNYFLSISEYVKHILDKKPGEVTGTCTCENTCSIL